MTARGDERRKKPDHGHASIHKKVGFGSVSRDEVNEARRSEVILEARAAIGAGSPDEAIRMLRHSKTKRTTYYGILAAHGIKVG